MKNKRKDDTELNKLISGLILSKYSLIESDPNFKQIFTHIKNSLHNNSLLYIPKENEIIEKLTKFKEKFILNSQREKAKLLEDLLERIQEIYKDKNIPLENVYNMIYLLMKISFNPINNPVNIELIRENFETRCITNQKKRIVKKANLNPLIIYENEKPFDEEAWKYLQEESIDIDSSSEEIIVDQHIRNKEEIKENIEKKELEKDKKKILKKKFIFPEKFDIDKKLYLLKRMYPNIYKEKEKRIYSHLLKISSRFSYKKLHKFTKFIQNIEKSEYINYTINTNNNIFLNQNQLTKLGISIEFLINAILQLFLNKQASLIKSIDDFNNFFFVDSNQLILKHIMEDVLVFIQKINYLRTIEKKLDELKIIGSIGQSLIAFTNDYMLFFDFVSGNLSKILNYQLGKITKSQMNNDFQYHFEKILRDNFKYSQPLFKYLLNKHKEYIHKVNQLTINGFFLYIKTSFEEYTDFLIIVFNEIEESGKRFKKNNEIVTYFFNRIFRICRHKISMNNTEKFLFYFTFFLNLHISYFEILFNFINYGHLVDIHGEFFIDHQITYSNKKTKMIYNFDDNFINHPWKKSFGIIKWTDTAVGESCVPDLLKIDNIAIEILESGKISFILNNLKQTKNKQYKLDFTVCKVILEDVLYQTIDYLTNLTSIESLNMDSNFEISNGNNLLNFERIVNDSKYLGIVELNKLNEEIKSINLKMLVSKEQENLPFYSEKHNEFHKIFCLKFPNKNLLNPAFSKNQDEILLENRFKKEEEKIENYTNSEDINKSLNDLRKLIETKTNSFTEVKKNHPINYDLGFIISHNILSRIHLLNLNLNKEVIKYFFSYERLQLHFDFTFKIFLFENSFGMTNFSNELFKMTENSIVDNQYLKYRLEDIFQNHEFNPYKEFFNYSELILSHNSELLKKGFRYEINKIYSDKSYLTFNYKPKWPISIFFYEEVLNKFNRIFNFLFRVKKYSSEINSVEIDKNIKMLYNRMNKDSFFLRIMRHFISLRTLIVDFINNYEYFIFYIVISRRLKHFRQELQNIKSMNNLINANLRLTNEIYHSILMSEGFKVLVEELFRQCSSFLLVTRNILCFNFDLELNDTDKISRLNGIFNEINLIKSNFMDNYSLFKQVLNNSKEFQLVKI